MSPGEAPAESGFKAVTTYDRQLVDAVLRKDRKATAEFVSAHADAIYSYVRRRLVPRADLVDDLVQEVFLAAWETLDRFRSEAPLRAWLLGIARHKVENYYRSRLRAPGGDLDEQEPAAAASGAEESLNELLDQRNREARARQVLASLPEACALVLLWRYWELRSAREIAAATGKTEKAVERMLARAREQFRRRWTNG